MAEITYSENLTSKWIEELGYLKFDEWSFLLGVYHPLPSKYYKLSKRKKCLWRVYSHLGDVLTFLLFISNLGGLIIAYHDVKAVVTCIGSLTYILCFWTELIIYWKKEKTIKCLAEFFNKICSALKNNPLGDKTYPQIYDKYLKYILLVGRGKLGVMIIGVSLMITIECCINLPEELDEKRILPMFGWYPYDTRKRLNYFFTGLFEFLAYLSFLLKDVVLDCFCLIILVTINSYLIYLKHLLELMMNCEKQIGLLKAQKKKEILRWWVIHHQMVLKSLADLKEVTNIYLLCKYVSALVILFFGGVLVTTEPEYDLVQQMIILAMNSSNLFQLYVFSLIGNEITQNGARLTEFGFNVDLIYNKKVLTKEYIFIAARCSKPIFICFGKINVLSVSSFAMILKVTFSYFITTVQIRGKSIKNINSNILFHNSTET